MFWFWKIFFCTILPSSLNVHAIKHLLYKYNSLSSHHLVSIINIKHIHFYTIYKHLPAANLNKKELIDINSKFYEHCTIVFILHTNFFFFPLVLHISISWNTKERKKHKHIKTENRKWFDFYSKCQIEFGEACWLEIVNGTKVFNWPEIHVKEPLNKLYVFFCQDHGRRWIKLRTFLLIINIVTGVGVWLICRCVSQHICLFLH